MRSSRHRRGLTLLEVLLALAILGGALATVGELMRIGARNAEIARDKTTAQLLAETTMGELKVGFLPLQSSAQAAVADVEYQEDWCYTVLVEPVNQGALVSVSVTVEQNPAVYSRPVSLTLRRSMIDETLLTNPTPTASATGS